MYKCNSTKRKTATCTYLNSSLYPMYSGCSAPLKGPLTLAMISGICPRIWNSLDKTSSAYNNKFRICESNSIVQWSEWRYVLLRLQHPTWLGSISVLYAPASVVLLTIQTNTLNWNKSIESSENVIVMSIQKCYINTEYMCLRKEYH